MSGIKLLPMAPAHVAQVAALERLCFADPWSERSIAAELQNPLSCWLVAEEGGQVLGYAGSQAVLDEADVMNVAVQPEARRMGLGADLMRALMAALRQRGVGTLSLEVRVSNAPAIALYQALGFSEAGRRHRYYRHPVEDALILRRTLAEGNETDCKGREPL